MLALQSDALLSWRQADPQMVCQPYRLVNSADFMEAVLAFGKDFESEINFGKSAGLDSFLHRTWQGVIRF